MRAHGQPSARRGRDPSAHGTGGAVPPTSPTTASVHTDQSRFVGAACRVAEVVELQPRVGAAVADDLLRLLRREAEARLHRVDVATELGHGRVMGPPADGGVDPGAVGRRTPLDPPGHAVGRQLADDGGAVGDPEVRARAARLEPRPLTGDLLHPVAELVRELGRGADERVALQERCRGGAGLRGVTGEDAAGLGGLGVLPRPVPCRVGRDVDGAVLAAPERRLDRVGLAQVDARVGGRRVEDPDLRCGDPGDAARLELAGPRRDVDADGALHARPQLGAREALRAGRRSRCRAHRRAR